MSLSLKNSDTRSAREQSVLLDVCLSRECAKHTLFFTRKVLANIDNYPFHNYLYWKYVIIKWRVHLRKEDGMGKVYLFLAEGFETIEALTVVDVLRRAKMPIVTVSITDSKSVMSVHNIKIEADQIFSECNFSDAQMLVLPGGVPGTPNLEAHEGLSQLLDEAVKKNIKIAAICAAPSILGKKGFLNGKEATAYPGYEQALIGADVKDEKVIVDGNYITARGMGVTIEFALTILGELGRADEAKRVSEAIQFYPYYK